jgi:hypothetical protein
MSQLTGFFRLSMRAEGKELTAIAQIHSPGLPGERLVHILRCEWADRLRPGLSQNRIECLGWERIEAPPADWEAIKGGSENPVTIWRPPASAQP